MITVKKIKTPIGEMIAGAMDDGICLFDFPYRKMMPGIENRLKRYFGCQFKEGAHPHFDDLEAQVREYFEGEREAFSLPLLYSGSDFQVEVWNELLKIPYGEKRTYKQQSVSLGKPDAIRAVASANGQNCLALLVPCHRVIGEDGSLTGYAGGLPNKKWLLKHEMRGRVRQGELF